MNDMPSQPQPQPEQRQVSPTTPMGAQLEVQEWNLVLMGLDQLALRIPALMGKLQQQLRSQGP